MITLEISAVLYAKCICPVDTGYICQQWP